MRNNPKISVGPQTHAELARRLLNWATTANPYSQLCPVLCLQPGEFYVYSFELYKLRGWGSTSASASVTYPLGDTGAIWISFTYDRDVNDPPSIYTHMNLPPFARQLNRPIAI